MVDRDAALRPRDRDVLMTHSLLSSVESRNVSPERMKDVRDAAEPNRRGVARGIAGGGGWRQSVQRAQTARVMRLPDWQIGGLIPRGDIANALAPNKTLQSQTRSRLADLTSVAERRTSGGASECRNTSIGGCLPLRSCPKWASPHYSRSVNNAPSGLRLRPSCTRASAQD